LLVFGVAGLSEARLMPSDGLPVRSANLSSLSGAVFYPTGSTAEFRAYGSGSTPVSGFSLSPHGGSRGASALREFQKDSYFESGGHPDFTENAHPRFSSRASAPDNITFEQVSPFSRPSMMLLVGCGLVGLAGIGRKMFQGRRMFRK